MQIRSTISKEIIVFTSCAMVLTAIGIDIMLPAFADLRQHFSMKEDATETSKLVSYFFMGQITQIIFGYLTDKMGRLPILRLGILLYIVCGFATVYATSLEWMFVFRFISGMGAAAVMMTSIASVRDRYAGNEMARIMSIVLTIFLFTPIVAPALGSLVLKFYSWKIVFLIPPTFAIIVFFWSFRMVETHTKQARANVNIKTTLPKIKEILTDWHFMRYISIATLIFSILSSYVSSSERIVGEIYQSPALFPFIFAAIGCLMAVFSFGNSYITKRFGAKKTLRNLLLAYFGVSTLLLISNVFIGNPPPMTFFFGLIAILMALTTAADPNSSAMALEFLGDNAGVAASIYGTIFFFIGSAIGSLISTQLIDGVLPLAICAVIFSGVSVGLAFSDN
jgi:DHA1 family bicyclomycin/chloramphenicol resistance-like MFS transporter